MIKVAIHMLGFVLVVAACQTRKSSRKTPRPNTSTAVESQPQASTSTYGHIPTSITRSIIQDRSGDIWFATFAGLIRSDGKSFSDESSTITEARFFSALEDSDNNLWFGTIGQGVYRYKKGNFQNLNTSNGLLNDEVVCIYEDTNGDLWFGVNGGVSRYDGSAFTNYIIDRKNMIEAQLDTTVTNFIRPPNGVNSITQDETGQYWFATNSGLFTYQGKSFSQVSVAGKEFSNVRDVSADQHGHIWIGGSDGLWVYDGTSYRIINNDFTGNIYQDRTGNIWTSSEINSAWALTRYDQATLHWSSPSSTIIKANERMFFGILEDNDQNIWIGKLDGIYKYNHSDFQDFKQ